MKIKFDFISNSSSTSFIYIAEKNFAFDKEAFFNAVGISKDSPLIAIFEHFYSILEDKLFSGKKITNEKELPGWAYSAETIEKVKSALEHGKNVIEGKLESAGDIAEGYLCMEYFEINSDDIYINAFNNYW